MGALTHPITVLRGTALTPALASLPPLAPMVEQVDAPTPGPLPDVPTMADPRRRQIVARFLAVLNTLPARQIQLPLICQRLGVSDRVLRHHCAVQLGMGPQRYATLHRMMLARAALTRGGTATVTEVATAHGFDELGRFSVRYRALFGEKPSSTLRRACAHQSGAPNPAPPNRAPADHPTGAAFSEYSWRRERSSVTTPATPRHNGRRW
jgi:AraC-like DNA-binding protein